MIMEAYRIKPISQGHCSVQFPGIHLVTIDEEVLLIQPDPCEI